MPTEAIANLVYDEIYVCSLHILYLRKFPRVCLLYVPSYSLKGVENH